MTETALEAPENTFMIPLQIRIIGDFEICTNA